MGVNSAHLIEKNLVENSGYNANHSGSALGLYKTMSFDWVSGLIHAGWQRGCRGESVPRLSVVLEVAVSGSHSALGGQPEKKSEKQT